MPAATVNHPQTTPILIGSNISVWNKVCHYQKKGSGLMEFLTVDAPEAATSRLEAELARFGKDKSESVNLLRFDWETIWRQLVNVGIYRRGPDVSEIGSTWTESLVAMDSLAPFSVQDIYHIGGKDIFLPVAWQNVVLANQNEVWGVPFRLDVRMIFYWKDMFEKASVDASQAFGNVDSMTDAFTRLQEAGIPAWIAPTNNSQNNLYNMASWIWGLGGDFLTPDAKQTKLDSPAVRRGTRAYFDLIRFMPKQTSPFTGSDSLNLFLAREAAAMVAGPWLLNLMRLRKEMQPWLPHLGIAPMPGPSFVGGSVLVIWKHAKSHFNSVEFVKRLTSREFQADYCIASGMLPVRQDLWTDAFIQNDEYLSVFNNAIHTGRPLPPAALWGMVEEHLCRTMGVIWQELYVLNMPGKPIDALDQIIDKHFGALSARLDITLSETDRRNR
jgi:multiple sugar transport system substrate-binding protein